MGLCSFISTQTAGETTSYGNTGPVIMFLPTPPASGQTAGCDFIAPGEPVSESTMKLSIAPTVRGGVNELTQLAAQPSASLTNINGNQIVWNSKTGVLYLEFPDRNPVYVASSTGTDSILTVADIIGANAYPGVGSTAPTWLVAFAEHVADGVTSGHVVTASMCPRCQGWGTGPMLIDDKGRKVSNPLFVMSIYEALLSDDTATINGASSNFAYLPGSDQQEIFSEIARSMTVHPDCSSTQGCIYPDFAVTGWNSATARADGLKLGVDPAKVPDPQGLNGSPVYISIFPTCMCEWEGTNPVVD